MEFFNQMGVAAIAPRDPDLLPSLEHQSFPVRRKTGVPTRVDYGSSRIPKGRYRPYRLLAIEDDLIILWRPAGPKGRQITGRNLDGFAVSQVLDPNLRNASDEICKRDYAAVRRKSRRPVDARKG